MQVHGDRWPNIPALCVSRRQQKFWATVGTDWFD